MRRAIVPLLLVLILAGGLVYQLWYLPTRFAVDIGSGMLAKQLCSCLFVASRDLEDCRADQFESMDPIRVVVQSGAGQGGMKGGMKDAEAGGAEAGEPGVRAFVPGFGERFAGYRPGLGCTLE